jgi:hypothetical protein
MHVDMKGEAGDRASDGQAAGVYDNDFTAGSLKRVAARDRTWRLGIEVGSDKELSEVRRSRWEVEESDKRMERLSLGIHLKELRSG